MLIALCAENIFFIDLFAMADGLDNIIQRFREEKNFHHHLRKQFVRHINIFPLTFHLQSSLQVQLLPGCCAVYGSA